MLILSRRDVLDLLTLPDCIEAVETAFRLHADGRTLGPGVLAVPAGAGSFHIKAAGLAGERRFFAAKTNANFPENPRRHGLPKSNWETSATRRSRSDLVALVIAAVAAFSQDSVLVPTSSITL
jgi:ornithine cyclodeaminase/alanine dehydrogenase-like protein (mu-crystallin family)